MKLMKKICLGLLLFWCGGSIAKADLYTVSEVPIAAELDSVREARSAAIQNGETEAFWSLMKKMVAPENLQQVPQPSESDIVDFVQHVSLANEKNTATKYMASLTVRFREDKIQDFLTRQQIPFLTQELPSAVVIPLWQRNGEVLSLEERNPVYTYLKDLYASDDADKIVVPTGELEEIVWVQEALENQNETLLKRFSDKYGTESVMILTVSEAGETLKIGTRYMPPEPALETEHEQAMPILGVSAVFPKIWRQMLAERQEQWQRLKMQNFESAMTFWTQVPVSQLSEWRIIREKLKKSNLLENLTVRGFRPKEVWITFQYKGTSAELNRQLKSLGLYLDVGDISGVWVLTHL